MLLDLLYQLTDQELRSAPIGQRKLERIVATASAGNVSADTQPVPLDKVGIITHIAMTGASGAGQTCSELYARVRSPENTDFLDIMVFFPTPALLVGSGQIVGPVFCFPGEYVRGQGFFSAAANPNTTVLSVHWLFVPKGNLQLR